MRIRYRVKSAGPEGVFNAGAEREVDDKTGKMLVGRGYAEEVKTARPAAAPKAAAKPKAAVERDVSLIGDDE